MTLYADRNTDLTIAGDFRMNAAQTNFFNPALIVLLAPLFAALWGWLGRRGAEPSTPLKFGLGLLLRGFILGVAPADPVVFVVAPVVLLAAALAACWVPAARAAASSSPETRPMPPIGTSQSPVPPPITW